MAAEFNLDQNRSRRLNPQATGQAFFIIYPTRRYVPAHEMCMRASDAVANGHIDKDGVDLNDAKSCAHALHDAGQITLARFHTENR